MANRTLRRAYNGNERNAQLASDADGSNAGNASESVIGNENTDSSVNGNGEESIRESDSVSGVSYVTIDPDKLGDYIYTESARNRDDNGSNTGKRKYTRRNDSPGRPRKTAEIPTLVTIHNVLNTWGQFLFKEFALDAKEKAKLDNALEQFAQYHELPLLTQKRASEIELINALALVYGPRVVAISMRKKFEAQMKRANKKQAVPFVSPMNQQDAVQ